MTLGKRDGERQEELFVATDQLTRAPGHIFYRRLNELLAEAKFDRFVEDKCKPFCSGNGRPGIYFRMLLIGNFEGIGSQRGIAWRCADSRSLSEFLGCGLTEQTPDHSSLSRIHERLPHELHAEVFQWVLALAAQKKLLEKTSLAVGVDSTTDLFFCD